MNIQYTDQSRLGFEVGAGELAKVRERYLALHPKLAALGPPRKYTATTTTRTAEKGDEDEDTTTIKMQTKKTIITTVTVFDVFAYYRGGAIGDGDSDGEDNDKAEADPGTVLRFIERGGRVVCGGGQPQHQHPRKASDNSSGFWDSLDAANDPRPSLLSLPGLEALEATFEDGAMAAYCDHWVSNVASRVGFLVRSFVRSFVRSTIQKKSL